VKILNVMAMLVSDMYGLATTNKGTGLTTSYSYVCLKRGNFQSMPTWTKKPIPDKASLSFISPAMANK
jgi:hypothetical protein